jgi:hypothetical protein
MGISRPGLKDRRKPDFGHFPTPALEKLGFLLVRRGTVVKGYCPWTKLGHQSGVRGDGLEGGGHGICQHVRCV